MGKEILDTRKAFQPGSGYFGWGLIPDVKIVQEFDMQTDDKTFETWAIVEVMGHRQFAGFVSEQPIGGASFVRVDVPAVDADGEQLPAFTKLLGAGSIYAISPCTEETARAFAARSRQRSFATYEAPRLPAPDTESKYCTECGCELTRTNCTGLCVHCESEDETDYDDVA